MPAALPVVAVLAVDPGGYASFGPAKWLVVSAAVPAAAATALAYGRGGPDRRTTSAGVAFLVWTGVCAVVGVDRWYALVGTPERHAGLWLWLLATAAFVTGVRTASAGAGRVVAQGPALAACVTGAYAACELVWRAPVATDASLGRLGGPLGSAAFLGAACCLLLPAAAGVALDQGSSRAWRSIGGAGTAGHARGPRRQWDARRVARCAGGSGDARSRAP